MNEDTINNIVIGVLTGTGTVGFLALLLRTYLTEQIKQSIKSEYDQQLALVKDELAKNFEAWKKELSLLENYEILQANFFTTQEELLQELLNYQEGIIHTKPSVSGIQRTYSHLI